MNLTYRSTEEEIMDDLEISGDVVAQTLRELDIINRLLGGNNVSLHCLKKLIKSTKLTSLVDLGCGGADILKQMAAITGNTVSYTGIDANPHIVSYAANNVAEHDNIQVACTNIFSDEFKSQTYDVIHCCLFLHHFTHEQLVSLFTQFKKQANKAIIVNDLHRHFLAYYSIKWITRFFSRSYMVRNDAALSVARGFRLSELKQIFKEAGITNYSIKWKWAFRWQILIICD